MSDPISQDAIVRLGPFDAHGTTRARIDGRSIEVEHGIPGELARIEISAGRRPRGHIVGVLEASPHRIIAPCVYFREWSCGGCQWQHIAYAAQLGQKRADTDAAMRRTGLAVTVSTVHALDEPWRYRSTASIALGKRAGFRRHGSLAIVPIEDCPISHPLMGALMADLNALLEEGWLPDFRGRVRIEARVADAPASDVLHVLIRLDRDRQPPEAAVHQLATTLSAMSTVQSVLLEESSGAAGVVSGDPLGSVDISGRAVTVSAAAFFQTNLVLLPRMIERVRETSSPLAGKRVADLYGGVGIFGLFLARDAAEVLIVESNPVALVCAERTAREWGLQNVRYLTKRTEEAIAGLAGYELVVVDPPRTGLGREVVDGLLYHRPARILYVSCLAESLARDLAAFTAGSYRITELELFDFYPQTYHVELLAVLERG